MREFLRTGVWGVALFTGLWLIVFIDPSLTRFFLPKDEARWLTWSGREGEEAVRDAPLAASSLLSAIYATLSGESPNQALGRRAVRIGTRANLYLRSKDPAYKELSLADCSVNFVHYLRFSDEGSTRALGVHRVDFSHIRAFAPAELVHPYRRMGFALVGVGWAVFWLLPWRQGALQTLRYKTNASYVGPMLIGSLLGGLFFFLALSIPIANDWVGAGTAAEIYFPLTLVALAFTLPAWIFWLIGLHYRTFGVVCADKHVDLERWGGCRRIAASEISRATIDEKFAPRWLRVLAVIVAILRPRQGGPLLLGAFRSNPVLTLWKGKQRLAAFSIKSLDGLPCFLEWLNDRGIYVEVSESLAEPLSELPKCDSESSTPPDSNPSQLIRFCCAGVGLIVAVVALAGSASPVAISY